MGDGRRKDSPVQAAVVGVGEQDVEEHVQQCGGQEADFVHTGSHAALAAKFGTFWDQWKSEEISNSENGNVKMESQ